MSLERIGVSRHDRDLVSSWEDIKLLREHAEELAWLERLADGRRERPPVSLATTIRRRG